MASVHSETRQRGPGKPPRCFTRAVVGLHYGRNMAVQLVEESKESSLPEKQTRAVTELAISGMTCGNCARHVTEALQSVPGVRSANVKLDKQQASVRWAAEARPNLPLLVKAVEEAGYQARLPDLDECHHAPANLGGW